MQYIIMTASLILIAVVAFADNSKQFIEASTDHSVAIFGGGCFWCMEPPFEQLDGVIDVEAGYSGGSEVDPSYGQVAGGKTGHIEAVRVVYDSKKITYKELLDTYWRSVDPTDAGGQFADRGNHYKTAIFYSSEREKEIAQQSKKELGEGGVFDKPIVTAIRPIKPFYRAEEYHQDYYKKNVFSYKSYKVGSGRDGFLKKTWKEKQKIKQYVKPSDKELKSKLTKLQYEVTQKDGTEPPYNNSYWDNKKEGIYVDVVSGEPLFSSLDKYDSKTGWPSFTKPLVDKNIVQKKDIKLFMVRIEVRSANGDSHLGHVFEDGPPPTGLRYCINSASLRFVPASDLEKEGYGDLVHLFN